MITTRPLRENDSKVFVSEKEFFKQLKENKLVGEHKNDNGYNYAYRTEDICKINQICIVEINPVFQKPEFLSINDKL
jgi:guanylate kinase